MAVYRVQAPDGSILRIEGPDDATDQQIMQAAEVAFAQMEATLPETRVVADIDPRRQVGATPESIALQQREAVISQIPGVDGMPVPPQPERVEPTLSQDIVGAGEAALTTLTGATGGTLGTLAGTLEGLAQEILSGRFGTPEAQRAVEAAASRRAQQLTFAPRTERGQEMAQAVGEAAAGIPAFIPVVGQAGTISQSARAAAIPAEAAVRRGVQVAREAPTMIREAVPGMVSPGRVSVGAAATPDVLRRVATAEGLPVPITLTKGGATRDPQQLAFEKEQIKSALGGPLRQRAEENNLQALQNFDVLAEMTDAQLMDLSSTGGAVVKSLTDGLTAAKNKTRAAFKAADKAGELESNVTLKSVVNYINENIPEGDLAPILKAAQQKAIAIGAAIPDKDGILIPQPITLRQAESLRQTFQRAGFEGADQFHGGSLKRAFDVETEGMGGDLYKKARQIRVDQARKFENRAIVARLIKNRKNTEDPIVAADQVFRKSILNSSPEEITFLKRVLLTSGKDGQQAFKELQGATIRHLRDEATKGLGMDSQDRPIISPAKLHQAIQALDSNGRLDVILGKKNAQTVREVDSVVRYVTTVPPGTLVNSSGTAGTLMAAIAEAGATGALTGLPVPVASGLRLIMKMRREGRTKDKINDALNALPPVQP